MSNTDSIHKLAQYLKANDAPGTDESHLEFLGMLSNSLVNQAQYSEIEGATIDAIFEYVANHHSFDIDSHEKTKTIIETIFEMACPMAADDEQSKQLLIHLKANFEKRINEL